MLSLETEDKLEVAELVDGVLSLEEVVDLVDEVSKRR